MKTKVQLLREEKNLTQTELAEKSGLSIRTIQRIEAGNTLKGFTLKTLANALDTKPENLTKNTHSTKIINRIKLINISALTFLIIPFGNIIFPAILIYRSKESEVKELGKSILSIQIIYTFVLSILLIISPFVQKIFSIKTPLFILILIVMIGLNLYIIFKNGVSLTKTNRLYIKLKTNII